MKGFTGSEKVHIFHVKYPSAFTEGQILKPPFTAAFCLRGPISITQVTFFGMKSVAQCVLAILIFRLQERKRQRNVSYCIRYHYSAV